MSQTHKPTRDKGRMFAMVKGLRGHAYMFHRVPGLFRSWREGYEPTDQLLNGDEGKGGDKTNVVAAAWKPSA